MVAQQLVDEDCVGVTHDDLIDSTHCGRGFDHLHTRIAADDTLDMLVLVSKR